MNQPPPPFDRIGETEEVTPIAWWRTGLGDREIARLVDAIRSERIAMGAETELLEEELAEALGVPYTIVTPSGSVALLLSLLAHDIGPGDEVILPARTFIAPAHAVVLAGARPVVVDTLPDTPLLDTRAVESKVTSRTRAILPVHLNGRGVALHPLQHLAAKHGLALIEDACQALFSRDERGYLGTRGVGCFSFGVAKLITTGYGGAVACHDPTIRERIIALRNHGIPGSGRHTHDGFGFNFKFSDMLAAIGREQLRSAPAAISRVTAIHDMYEHGTRELPFIDLLPADLDRGEIPIYAEAVAPERAKLREFLENRGVQCQGIAPSLHNFAHLRVEGAYPHAERFDRETFILPCGPTQPVENVGRVIELLRQYPG